MSAPKAMFSSAWHRVAKERVALRSTVKVKKQLYRGKTWYLIHDPFNNTFFRVGREGYRFVSRLTPGKTVEQVWEKSLEMDGDGAPGRK